MEYQLEISLGNNPKWGVLEESSQYDTMISSINSLGQELSMREHNFNSGTPLRLYKIFSQNRPLESTLATGEHYILDHLAILPRTFVTKLLKPIITHCHNTPDTDIKVTVAFTLQLRNLNTPAELTFDSKTHSIKLNSLFAERQISDRGWEQINEKVSAYYLSTLTKPRGLRRRVTSRRKKVAIDFKRIDSVLKEIVDKNEEICALKVEPAIKFSSPFSFLTENENAGERTFGLELEIDFSYDFGDDESTHDGENYYKKKVLAELLYENGLAKTDRLYGWRAQARSRIRTGDSNARIGYTRDLDGWTVETDSTVDNVGGRRGCELVSPILTNTPEAWESIRKVLQIVKELGGKVTTHTGLHVNIGMPDFNPSMDDSQSLIFPTHLIDLHRQFDDLLQRLAHNPATGSQRHRGSQYCSAPAVISALLRSSTSTGDFTVARQALSYRAVRNVIDRNGHYSAINMDHLMSPNVAHRRLEFRIWDGTIDFDRLQTLVGLTLSLVDKAVKSTLETHNLDNIDYFGSRNTRGTNRSSGTGNTPEQNREQLALFATELGLTPTQTRNMIGLFAQSNWQ